MLLPRTIKKDFVWSIKGDEKQVTVSGSFCKWKTNYPLQKIDECHFHTQLSIKVPEDGLIQYKYVIDGEWRIDENCPTIIENGISNNVFDLKEHLNYTSTKHEINTSTISEEDLKRIRMEKEEEELQKSHISIQKIDIWANGIVEDLLDSLILGSKNNFSHEFIASVIHDAVSKNTKEKEVVAFSEKGDKTHESVQNEISSIKNEEIVEQSFSFDSAENFDKPKEIVQDENLITKTEATVQESCSFESAENSDKPKEIIHEISKSKAEAIVEETKSTEKSDKTKEIDKNEKSVIKNEESFNQAIAESDKVVVEAESAVKTPAKINSTIPIEKAEKEKDKENAGAEHSQLVRRSTLKTYFSKCRKMCQIL